MVSRQDGLVAPRAPVPVRRVAMISLHTCPYAALGGKETGGMNVYVRELSRQLALEGIQVDVFTRSQDPAVPRVVYISEGVRNVHVPAGPEAPRPKAELVNYLEEFVGGVVAFAGEAGMSYDLIHSHYWLSGLASLKLRRFWGSIPLIQMFHTLGHLKNAVAESPEVFEPPIRLESERRLMAEAEAIVAANPSDLENMVRLYGADRDKISTIPCGVDLELFRPLPREEARDEVGVVCLPNQRLILYVGRLEPLKGVDVLMHAMALVMADFDDPLCLGIIGGNGEGEDELSRYERRLQALRRELGLEKMVLFLGAKEQTRLPYYYNAADVVAMPSHYESFGMVALEAMACGRPVVASAVGGLQHTVREGRTGFLAPADDPEAFAEPILRLLGDPPLGERLGREGARVAGEYAWPGVAGRVLDLYREVLGAPVG